MITAFFLTIVYLLAGGIITILPTATALPTQFVDGVTLLANYLSAFSWLLPIYQLINAIIFIIAFDVIVLGFRLSVWVLKLIRPH